MEAPKPYTLQWFMQELVRAIFVAAAMLTLSVAAMGILQAYLLPQRMEQESEKIQKKFDDQITKVRGEAEQRRADAMKRQAALIAELEALKKLYAEGIKLLRPKLPDKQYDEYEKRMLDQMKMEQHSSGGYYDNPEKIQ